MKAGYLLTGGVVAGLVIITGEAVLNLWLLAAEWEVLFARFDLPPPSVAVAMQGLAKLLLLGVFSVWLTAMLRPAFATHARAAIAAGLVVWFLVWAWVQWGMLLAGYVTPSVAMTTVAWGLVELPLAVWLGARVQEFLALRGKKSAHGVGRASP